MVLLSAAGASTSEKCQVANEVVTAFIAIPTSYHRAISVPLLFHIGVIGQILGTTLEEPLGENDCTTIREVMITMADFLSTLEGPHASKGASQRLREQVARIDGYMASQRRMTRVQKQSFSSVNNLVPSGQGPSTEAVFSVYEPSGIDETLGGRLLANLRLFPGLWKLNYMRLPETILQKRLQISSQ